MITHTDERGFVWKPFAVRFESPDGPFCFSIMALSFEHACLQVDAIKETASVDGQIESVIAP